MIQTYFLNSGSNLKEGKYVIQEKLGSGGFGITYKGVYTKEVDIKERFHNMKTTIAIPVAIKELFIEGKCVRGGDNSTIFLQSLAIDEFSYFKSRFLQEAETLSKFNIVEQVVHVIDYFEENDTAYMVMAYVEGETLQQFVKRKGKLSELEALGFIEQLCKGLVLVHAQNVLHRDIKPANIIIDKNGNVVLIDFGSAREYVANEGVTMSVILTQGYAPIEQYSKKRAQGPYTDIYALGATLYYCLTGKNPDSVHDIADEREKYVPWASPHVNKLIQKAMAFEPKNRFQDCEEMLSGIAVNIGFDNITELNTNFKSEKTKLHKKEEKYAFIQDTSTEYFEPNNESNSKPSSNKENKNSTQILNRSNVSGYNKKVLAGLLAIFLGCLGVHKFILGYKKEGIIMVASSVVGLFLCGIIPTLIMLIVGLVEGIMYLTKSDEHFYNTYQLGRKPWF